MAICILSQLPLDVFYGGLGSGPRTDQSHFGGSMFQRTNPSFVSADLNLMHDICVDKQRVNVTGR